MFRVLALTVPLLFGCGDSDDPPTGPGGGGGQTASATATPSSATIARGESATTTIVFSATGGLTIGSSFTINMPFDGISVTQISAQTVGSTITQVQEIGIDASTPLGTHEIHFSTPVSGYVGGAGGPTSVRATFTVTVTE